MLARLRKLLGKRTWSPYACGALLGVIAALSLAFAHERLGASGAFETAASLLVGALGLSDVLGSYFVAVKPPEVDPGIALALGMVVGAYLAARLSGDFKVRSLPDEEWRERFGDSVPKRWAAVFFGCMLLAIGAGIAGGCTSGMGVSGTMQLSVSGIAFIIGCFTAGIAVAAVIYRGK